MPLNIGGGGGGGSFVRFKPSMNAWERSGENGAEEFDFNKPAIFDVENIELGWLLLDSNTREWKPWAAITKREPIPDEREWKQGFVLKVYSKELFGNDPVREFSGNGAGVMQFVKNLYDATEAEFGKGKVPVVKITGSKAEKMGKGNTRIIQFEVVKWVARPDVLGGVGAAPAPEPEPAAQEDEVEF